MSNSGYAKFRRGLVEHLKDGRMTADEYCAFSLVIQLADFRSGMWMGSGVAMSDYLKWGERKSQRLLRSLASKGYLELAIVPQGRKGNYPITVMKYHGSPSQETVNGHITVQADGEEPGSPSGETTLKEVKLKKEREEVRPAPKSRGSHHPFRSKTRTEPEATMQIVTQGPPRKDYLEFLELRDTGKLPKGMTWAKWRDLTPEEKKQQLKAA